MVLSDMPNLYQLYRTWLIWSLSCKNLFFPLLIPLWESVLNRYALNTLKHTGVYNGYLSLQSQSQKSLLKVCPHRGEYFVSKVPTVFIPN